MSDDASVSSREKPDAATRLWQRFYEVVSAIPVGKVATYGQIAELAGEPGCARQVGYALAALPVDHQVPWQRVINAKGQVSLRSENDAHCLQVEILKSEGIEFDAKMRVDLRRFAWLPRSSRRANNGRVKRK